MRPIRYTAIEQVITGYKMSEPIFCILNYIEDIYLTLGRFYNRLKLKYGSIRIKKIVVSSINRIPNRTAAAKQLAEIGSPKALRKLILCLYNVRGFETVYKRLLEVGSKVKPLLYDFIFHGSNLYHKNWAVKIFKDIGDNSDIRSLVKIYNNIEECREASSITLKSIGKFYHEKI